MLFVLWSFWPDLNRRPIDYESIALPTEPQKHVCALQIKLIHYMKKNTKKQAILHAFSDFFLAWNKEFHMSGQDINMKIAAHSLFAVQIPYDVPVRLYAKVRTFQT